MELMAKKGGASIETHLFGFCPTGAIKREKKRDREREREREREEQREGERGGLKLWLGP